jgi:hypothetical protein
MRCVQSSWHIECDSLLNSDIHTLASYVSSVVVNPKLLRPFPPSVNGTNPKGSPYANGNGYQLLPPHLHEPAAENVSVW